MTAANLRKAWLDAAMFITPNTPALAKKPPVPPAETACHRSQGLGTGSDDLTQTACQCFDMITRYLEHAETQGNRGTTLSMAELLRTSDVSRLRPIVACARCEARTDLMLMLVMLLRALGVVFTNLVHKGLKGHASGRDGDPAQADPAALGLDESPRVIVDSHLIEEAAERALLVRALVRHRLACLLEFVTMTQGRVKSREGLASILSGVESQVMKLSKSVERN